MRIVEQYLLQLNTEKHRLHRAVAILTVLSLVVVIAVGWNLRMTGVTMANDACCGIPEHLHTEECPVETFLACGYPMEPERELVFIERIVETPPPEEPIPEEPISEEITDSEGTEEAEVPAPAEAEPQVILEEVWVPVHTHEDSCWQSDITCGYEEHIHEIECYSDLSADLETAAQWEASLPHLSDQWANNLARVARSQLGYEESQRNFVLAEDGVTQKGITRYGQWYGNPYGNWSGMFALFCLNYANVPQSAVPWSPGVQNMLSLAYQRGIVSPADNTTGNLLFMDSDGNGNADHIFIVIDSYGDTVYAVSGDWNDAVCEVSLSVYDSRIQGCINVADLQAPKQPAPTEPEQTEATEPEDIAETTVPAETENTVATEPENTDQTEPEENQPETPDSTEPEKIPEETETVEESTETEAAEESEDTGKPTIDFALEYPEEGILWIVAEMSNFDESAYLWQWQVSEDGNEPWTDIEGAEAFVLELEDTEENNLHYYRIQGRKIEVQQRLNTYAIVKDSDTTESDDTITSGAVTPYSIGKNNRNYTIDIFAVAVDPSNNPISDIPKVTLKDLTVSNTTKINVSNSFDSSLGQYVSAYFGTDTKVEIDNIQSVWKTSNNNGYLAYAQTNGTQNTRWKNSADSSISLYLRYIPQFTVTISSEGYSSLTEKVLYGNCATLTEPADWTREGHTLAGWLVDEYEKNIYTYEDILKRPVTADVTYTAKWWSSLSITFDLGEFADELQPIEPMIISYGAAIGPCPAPAWKNNTVSMAFDGWYLDQDLTIPVTPETCFYENAVLYAKWMPKDDGYFIYYMDFDRQLQTPLVLMTSSVTEGKTASPYVPANAPEGMQWDGNWYLDQECTQVYDFKIPVSSMTDQLTGVNNRDLYLYPGTVAVCRAIFVTNGSRIDPITVLIGEILDLDTLIPERSGYNFAGWTLADGTPVSGKQSLTETTTYYATWEAGYVPFQAVLRVENANDTGMTQANILGTWYAKSGSQIRVNSTYTGSGTSRSGTHKVVCVLDGVEYPVYSNDALTKQATLADVYSTYFLYNNTGTSWTDEVNWDDVYTGGELPYTTRPISSAGDTVISFDYMRVRRDVKFSISNSNGYIDIYSLYQNGLINGSVTYTGTAPTTTGKNVSATGVHGTNISWTYTAASSSSGTNTYTLHNIKYDQRIYEVYPVGGSWITVKSSAFRYYKTGNGDLFASRRENASADFFTENTSGRKVTITSFNAEFSTQSKVALMYAVECLSDETPDFTDNNVGYKVQTQLCEVVNSSTDFSAKELSGCVNVGEDSYTSLNTTTSKIGDTSVKTLFGTTYWDYYKVYSGITQLSSINKAFIFTYNRLRTDVQFSFGYDSNGDGNSETVTYEDIAYGESLREYLYGAPNSQKHQLLNRDGYIFSGWMDGNGVLLKSSDWEDIVASGEGEESTMLFIAKWEKISGNIVEYYEDVSASAPFESHYFDDGDFLEYPTMVAYPQGWVWQEYGEGSYIRFDWDVPMYGEYGVVEQRQVAGEERMINVIRVYGTWDESHTAVVYDPNAAQGGVPGSAPVDDNEYTIWQSEVSVMSRVNTANIDPDMVFTGWLLDRDGIVYQPGDHVSVRWPRTMIFTAQWAKQEEVVQLRYDPNGATPEGRYPNELGFDFRKNSTAVVWNNLQSDGNPWFTRTGYTFTGWNTEPDGTGTEYPVASTIHLTEPITTLYAQWRQDTHQFTLRKVDRQTGLPLGKAIFELYKQVDGVFMLVETQVSADDGSITFTPVETYSVYKLVEADSPPGYTIMTREVIFCIAPEQNILTLQFLDDQGNVISEPSGITAEYWGGIQHLIFTVANVAGYALPGTGGMGTYLYILFGAILTIAPLVYGFGLRRRRERRAAR